MLMQLFPNCTQIHVLSILMASSLSKDFLMLLSRTMAHPLRVKSSKCMCVHKNGIKHMTSTLHHPSTNGQAERTLQTLKRGLKCTPSNSVQEKLSRFLFGYRITPHTTNWCFSMWDVDELQVKVSFRFLPEISGKVESRQAKQKLGATWRGHWDSSLKVYVRG